MHTRTFKMIILKRFWEDWKQWGSPQMDLKRSLDVAAQGGVKVLEADY